MDIEEELFGITHKHQAINSKLKGNKNELNVTHLLSDWTGHEFVRVPRSGGLRWQNRMNVCGDVISTDSSFDFIFNIETKHVANIGVRTVWLRHNSVIFKYFGQCERDALASKRIPFLIIRENGMPKDSYYIFLKLDNVQRQRLGDLLPFQCMSSDKSIVGFMSELFFKHIDYLTLKALWKS